MIPKHYEANLRGEVDVRCWCERSIVPVPVVELKDGWTRSCGRVGCEPPLTAA